MIAINGMTGKQRQVLAVPGTLKRHHKNAQYYIDDGSHLIMLCRTRYTSMRDVDAGHRYMHWEVGGVIYESYWTNRVPESESEKYEQLELF